MMNFLVIKRPDEEDYYLITKKTKEEIFFVAARTVVFSDCSDEELVYAVADGEPFEYVGWQPGMRVTFVRRDGKTVFDEEFPEWEH